MPPSDFPVAYPASRHPSKREAAFGRLSTKGGRPPGGYPYGWVSGGCVGKEESPRWQFKLPQWDFLLAYPASRHLSIREAAFGRLSTKGGGRPPVDPPFVDTLMDGCLEAG